MNLTLKQLRLFSAFALLVSIVLLTIGFLLGGSIWDGLAGATRTNTPLEDVLMSIGYFGGLISIALILITIVAALIKKFTPRTKA